jgi:hypothetical protein
MPIDSVTLSFIGMTFVGLFYGLYLLAKSLFDAHVKQKAVPEPGPAAGPAAGPAVRSEAGPEVGPEVGSEAGPAAGS